MEMRKDRIEEEESLKEREGRGSREEGESRGREGVNLASEIMYDCSTGRSAYSITLSTETTFVSTILKKSAKGKKGKHRRGETEIGNGEGRRKKEGFLQ
jgi:hypothetical protein